LTRPAEATASPPLTYPRFATLWATAVYGLASLVLGFPALAGQFLVNPRSDQYLAGYAFREYAATTLRTTGHFPLWNPYLLGGLPYVAAMHGDIFYPTFLLRMVMPTDAAMTWEFIIHLALAGLFTFVFLRSLGLGFYAALIGGLAYTLGGNVAGLASPGHDGKLFISALLPVTLFLMTRAVRDGRIWAYGALAFVVGLAILTPHPQLLQYLLLASGAFALLLAFTDTGRGRIERRVALGRLAGAGGAVVVGLAIGAIQFLPVREYVAWSPRAAGHSWELATTFSLPPEEIVNFYLPHFSGILELYWGQNNFHFHSDYVGAAVLVLVGLAFTRSWTNGQRRLVWFWLGTLVVSLLWAMGGFTPFYRLIYALVPGTKYFRAPSTMLFLVSFCTAVLAAYGTERAIRSGVSRRYLIGWAIAAALIALLGVSGGLTNLAVTLAKPGHTDIALANDAATRFGALRSTLFAAFALTVLFLLATRRLSRNISGILLALVIVVDLWSIERLYWVFSPPAAKLFASDPIIEYLKKQPEPGRVLPLRITGAEAYHDPVVLGDELMLYRVRNALGYHGNELGRFQRLEGDRGESLANPNWWALYNVRFIIADTSDLGGDLSTIKRVMGPVKDAAGSALYLFQITSDNPAAWVAPVVVKAADDAVMNTVLDPRFDVRKAALFDTSTKVHAQSIQALPEPLKIRAHVSRYDPEAIDIELDQPAPNGSALIMSENYYPGWSATVDGKPATIGRADVALIGVELPAGAKTVALRFTSASYETGRMITIIALLLALVAWGGGALVERVRV
jgi:membrane protein YfhO